ncbi:glycosyltransferase [Actinomadura sp. KC345]|nr:glycosyltransferase [Actinomadura sp. KC345]
MLADPGIRRVKTPERRFLFAAPPADGPVAAGAAVAAELARRGHKVAWTGHRPSLESRLRPGSRIFSAVEEDFEKRMHAIRSDWLDLRGLAALRFLWEEFLVPLGHAMLPGVEKAIDRFRPDVVIADQHALAAPVAARRREIPWATSAATSAEFARPLAAMPKVEEWVRDRIAGFQLDHGIDDLLDLRFSDHLVLVFSPAGLIGDTSFFPDHFAFVGPAPVRAAPRAFPWDRLDGRPAALVTMDDPPARFVRVAAEAVRDMDVQVILVAPPGVLADPPPNVLVQERVPEHKLLEHVSAVVCDGAHGTVCASLSNGLPLVAAPVRDDQPVIARQVEAAGAGVQVRHARCGADELRAALTAVLTDRRYRTAAEHVRETIAAAGGATEAADRLEKLA